MPAKPVAWDTPCEFSRRSNVCWHTCPGPFSVHTVLAALLQTSAVGTGTAAWLPAASPKAVHLPCSCSACFQGSFQEKRIFYSGKCRESFKAGEHHQKHEQRPYMLQSWETGEEFFILIHLGFSNTFLFKAGCIPFLHSLFTNNILN